MKIKYWLFFIIVLTICKSASTQQCEVTMPAISGTYAGNCKDNKANGNGNAKGEDSYEGHFIDGYPQGRGKYTWKNGNWHEGEFKKGMKEGDGVLHIKKLNESDSIVIGTWKNDILAKKHDKKYIIHYKTYMVHSVEVIAEKKGTGYNEVVLTVESVSGGSFDIRGEIQKPILASMDLRAGIFLTRYDVTNMQRRNVYYFDQVQFPFRAVFRITQQGLQEEVEIEFLEANIWKVGIKLRQ